MSKNPWMKFYPRDWRGDQSLRAVSIGARGLWMEMLCIMHEASPYGHLILGGHGVGDDVLARMAGTGVDEVSALLIELESAGVLSRTRRGVVYSRRMVKDHSRAETGRKSARRRWDQDVEKKEEKSLPNGLPNRAPITQKPEARVTVPDGTGGAPPDFGAILFSQGLQFLISCGQSDRNARGLLGKWRKLVRDDAWVVSELAGFQRSGKSDPVSWMEARVRQRASGPSAEDARKAEAAEIRRLTIERYKRMNEEDGVPMPN